MIVDNKGREVNIVDPNEVDALDYIVLNVEWKERGQTVSSQQTARMFFILCKNGLTTEELKRLKALQIGQSMTVVGNDEQPNKLTRIG